MPLQWVECGRTELTLTLTADKIKGGVIPKRPATCFFFGQPLEKPSGLWVYGPWEILDTIELLVGGWATPLKKYESIGMMRFPILMGKYIMFQTTNQIMCGIFTTVKLKLMG